MEEERERAEKILTQFLSYTTAFSGVKLVEKPEMQPYIEALQRQYPVVQKDGTLTKLFLTFAIGWHFGNTEAAIEE